MTNGINFGPFFWLFMYYTILARRVKYLIFNDSIMANDKIVIDLYVPNKKVVALKTVTLLKVCSRAKVLAEGFRTG